MSASEARQPPGALSSGSVPFTVTFSSSLGSGQMRSMSPRRICREPPAGTAQTLPIRSTRKL
ncbi:MAG: hypothetical protein IPH86_09165 [bacterium]|nr:hypothetical protein [bacterium]